MSVRHDWYQSETKVVITVLLKDAVGKNYKVNFERESLLMTADGYELDLKLYRPIIVEQSTHQAFPFKVEITVAKESGERWDHLEKQNPSTTAAAALPQIHKKDWDSLAKEVEKAEDAEAQSEEALHKLFRNIYKNSTAEVRMAMNKSFSESGGTVLSTNWNEVGKDRVDIKPPEGTEFRKWD